MCVCCVVLCCLIFTAAIRARIPAEAVKFSNEQHYTIHTFFYIRNSVLVPVLKVSYINAIFSCGSFLKVSKRKMEFKSINYDLKNNVSSHPQNSNKKLGNIQEELINVQ